MDSAVWGLIGTIVGALASVGTTFLTNKSAASLQTSTAASERAEAAKAFQRETIISMQEAVHNVMRLTARAYAEDQKAHAIRGTWGKTVLPDDLSEELRQANRNAMLLVERIASDSLRKNVKTVLADANDIFFATSPEQATTTFDRITFATVAIIEESGQVLRALY